QEQNANREIPPSRPFFPVCLRLAVLLKTRTRTRQGRHSLSASCRSNWRRFLTDTHTPSMSVAIVHGDAPEWIAGLGKADVAANRAPLGRGCKQEWLGELLEHPRGLRLPRTQGRSEWGPHGNGLSL